MVGDTSIFPLPFFSTNMSFVAVDEWGSHSAMEPSFTTNDNAHLRSYKMASAYAVGCECVSCRFFGFLVLLA